MNQVWSAEIADREFVSAIDTIRETMLAMVWNVVEIYGYFI